MTKFLFLKISFVMKDCSLGYMYSHFTSTEYRDNSVSMQKGKSKLEVTSLSASVLLGISNALAGQ